MVNIYLNLNENINLITDVNWAHITNCSCARYSDISTITQSPKYRLIIEKISRYNFFFIKAHP